MISMSGLIYLTEFKIKFKNKTSVAMIVGCLSGLLSSAVGTGGAPIVIYFKNQNIKKLNFKATISLFFLITTVVCLGVYYAAGLLTMSSITLIKIGIIPLMIGGLIGEKLTPFISQYKFERICLGIVVISGFWLIYQSIHSIIKI